MFLNDERVDDIVNEVMLFGAENGLVEFLEYLVKHKRFQQSQGYINPIVIASSVGETRTVRMLLQQTEIDPGELKQGGIAFRQEGEQPAPAAADLVKMLGRLARVCPFGDPSIEQRDNFKVAPEEDPLEAIIPVVVELRRVFAPVGGKEATEPGLVSLDEGLPEESVPDQGSQPVGPFAENLAWWPRGKRGHSRDREDA